MTFAAAVPDPQGRQLDQIRLDGVTATGHHGVLPHERAEGQVFSADVVLHLDTRAAASSDDLGATVSYADVARDVHDVLAGSPADLVETVAERIAAVALARDAVHTVDVRVHKPQAPIEVPFDDVAVVVRRDRAHAPAVDAPARPAAAAVAPEPVAPALGAAAATAAAAPPVPEPEAVPDPVPPLPVPAEPEAPAVDPLDVVPAEPVEAVLALGANLGDAQVTLREAVTDIDRLAGVQVTDVSPLARTAAVGGPDQPDYLNAVLVVRTTLSAVGLLDALQDVEEHHGRVREERWGPRTLDVDIVQYGTLTSTDPDLELPHPRAHERAFVLVPWAEIAPDAVLGGLGGGIVGQLAATAPDRAGIRWLALDWLTGPTQSTGQVAASEVAPTPSAPVPQAPDVVAEEAPQPDAAAQPAAQPAADDVTEAPPVPPWADPEERPAPDEAPPEPGPSASAELPARQPSAELPAPLRAPEAHPAPAPQPGGEPRPVPDPWPAPAPQEPAGSAEPQAVVPPSPSVQDVPDPATLPPLPAPAFDVPTAPEPRADAAQAGPPSGIIDSVPQATPAAPAPHAPVPPAPDELPSPPGEPEALRPYAAGPAEPRPTGPAEPAGEVHRPSPAEPRPATPDEPLPPVPPAPPETYPPFGGEPAQVNPFAPFGEPDPEPRPDDPGPDTGDERER